ncbi:hypothetical protein ACIRST_29930 [Kitasatospora sp. NPDC101447]|uniref:hypothetical protein n=1 Tax=Kitasatospora sp. NPDC101447 TaxID=3364102 RepID=UPI00382D62E7
MSRNTNHARHGGPGVRAALARRRVPIAATALAVLAGSALAMSARAAGPEAAPSPAAGAPASAVKVQQWVYPGPAGSAVCSAPSEYADGRLAQGVLKPEYYTIDATGSAALLSASDPDYACNGYSAANAADVKAHSAQQ